MVSFAELQMLEFFKKAIFWGAVKPGVDHCKFGEMSGLVVKTTQYWSRFDSSILAPATVSLR